MTTWSLNLSHDDPIPSNGGIVWGGGVVGSWRGVVAKDVNMSGRGGRWLC